MNALVFLVLKSERGMQIHLEQYRHYDDETMAGQPAPLPRQKAEELRAFCLEAQKCCECCE